MFICERTKKWHVNVKLLSQQALQTGEAQEVVKPDADVSHRMTTACEADGLSVTWTPVNEGPSVTQSPSLLTGWIHDNQPHYIVSLNQPLKSNQPANQCWNTLTVSLTFIFSRFNHVNSQKSVGIILSLSCLLVIDHLIWTAEKCHFLQREQKKLDCSCVKPVSDTHTHTHPYTGAGMHEAGL